MGLDMYLGVSAEDAEGNDVPIEGVDWRKANSIHGWFVSNVQDDVDDGNEYPVSIKQLKSLKSACLKVLAARSKPEASEVAMNLLPPTGGCFFGSTDLDEGYYEDMEYTSNELGRILREIKGFPVCKATYWASW